MEIGCCPNGSPGTKDLLLADAKHLLAYFTMVRRLILVAHGMEGAFMLRGMHCLAVGTRIYRSTLLSCVLLPMLLEIFQT